MLDITLNTLDVQACWGSLTLNLSLGLGYHRIYHGLRLLIELRNLLLLLIFCWSFHRLFILTFWLAKTFSPLSVRPMIIIHTSLAMWIILWISCSRAAVYRGLVLKVVMHLLIIVVWILVSSFPTSTSLWEPLIVATVVALLNAFVISLLLVPLVIIWLILATWWEASVPLVAVLWLGGASGWHFGDSSRIACFLHHLIVLVMFPFLILISLWNSVISRFLDNLPIAFLRILIVVILIEVVIVIASAAMVLMVVIPISPLVVTALAVPVISIVSIILVIIWVASISVLLIAVLPIVLTVSVISIAVPWIGSWGTITLEWRLSTSILRSTAISG